MKVSWTFLRMLGVSPALGRDFTAADDDPAHSRVVLISDALWRRRFASRADIVGSSIVLNGRPHAIAGVMPASFEPLVSEHFYARADIWAPLGYALDGDSSCRTCQHLKALARLRPGATISERDGGARVGARAAAARISDAGPGGTADRAIAARRHRWALSAAAPGAAGRSGVRAADGVANVAGLLMARGADRHRELAVRAALGAGTGRLVRQLMTESLVMAVAAGALALLLARWAIGLLAQHAPVNIPRLDRAATDPFLLAAAAVLAAMALFGFGLMPAWTAASTDPQHVLREGRSTSDGAPCGRVSG